MCCAIRGYSQVLLYIRSHAFLVNVECAQAMVSAHSAVSICGKQQRVRESSCKIGLIRRTAARSMRPRVEILGT